MAGGTRCAPARERFDNLVRMTGFSDVPWPHGPGPQRSRHEVILDAAWDLALARDVRSIGIGAIARNAGMHHSSVLNYFETREQIFLMLASRAWQEWAQTLEACLPEGPVSSSDVAIALAGSLEERPLFCDLLGHVPLLLIHNVPVEAAQAYDADVHEACARAGDTMVAALTRMGLAVNPRIGRDLVMAITAQAGMLWQMSRPPQGLIQLYRDNPDLPHESMVFLPQLAGVISLLILGLGGD